MHLFSLGHIFQNGGQNDFLKCVCSTNFVPEFGLFLTKSKTFFDIFNQIGLNKNVFNYRFRSREFFFSNYHPVG